MIFDPAAMAWRDVYKLMIGSVLPRPIAFVSTVGPDGVPNLAPYSFFTVAGANPATLCFNPMLRGSDAGKKDTLVNIEATGEFVINILSESMAEAMNETAFDFPPDVDEFTVSGLTPAPGEAVRVPRVLESQVAYECRLSQIVEVGAPAPGAGFLVLGTVVRIHVADSLLEQGRISLEGLRPIGRLGGDDYVRCTDRFTMVRPGRRS